MPLSNNATYQLYFEDCEKAAFPLRPPYLYILFVYFIFPLKYLLTVFFLIFIQNVLIQKIVIPDSWLGAAE